MKNSSTPLLSLALSAFVALSVGAACAEKPAGEAAAGEAKGPPAGPAYPAEAKAPVDETLAAYEEARQLFVADKLAGIDATAQKLAAAATKAQESAPEAAKPHLAGMVEAAKGLEAATKEGIEPARKAYGDVSKHVMGLLVAFPSLTEGRVVYECPMATGYQKWVQPATVMANPYMGQRMLKCGGQSDWKV